MFPFSPLPLLPQELILKKLSPLDRFKFSLVSQKCHLIAKRSKVVVQNLCWRFTTDDTDLLISGPINKDCFKLRIPLYIADSLEEKVSPARIDDINFLVHWSSFGGVLSTMFAGHREALAGAVTCRLLDVLNIQTFSMESVDRSIPPYILKTTRIFESVHAKFYNLPSCEEDASTLLNDISVDDFTLNSNGGVDYQPQQPLKHRRMILENASWFTKEVLMSHKCEELSVYHPNTNITSENLQKFFEAWKARKFPKLKRLDILTWKGFEWILDLAPVDEHDWQVIKDAGGNVGKLKMTRCTLDFVVAS